MRYTVRKIYQSSRRYINKYEYTALMSKMRCLRGALDECRSETAYKLLKYIRFHQSLGLLERILYQPHGRLPGRDLPVELRLLYRLQDGVEGRSRPVAQGYQVVAGQQARR